MASRKKRDDSADRPTLSLVSDEDSNPRAEQDPPVASSSDSEDAADAVEGVDPNSTESHQDEGVESEEPANSEIGNSEIANSEIPGLAAMSPTEQAQADHRHCTSYGSLALCHVGPGTQLWGPR